MQVFNVETIISNRRIIFNIESEYIKGKYPKEFYDDESITLDRIWPQYDINSKFFSNQENHSNKVNITREEAIVQLKELKELLDLGILSNDEYNEKASKLKTIILKDD